MYMDIRMLRGKDAQEQPLRTLRYILKCEKSQHSLSALRSSGVQNGDQVVFLGYLDRNGIAGMGNVVLVIHIDQLRFITE